MDGHILCLSSKDAIKNYFFNLLEVNLSQFLDLFKGNFG